MDKGRQLDMHLSGTELLDLAERRQFTATLLSV
jgi:hypothetical protein